MAVKGKEALNLKSNIHVDRVNETIGKQIDFIYTELIWDKACDILKKYNKTRSNTKHKVYKEVFEQHSLETREKILKTEEKRMKEYAAKVLNKYIEDQTKHYDDW